MIDFILNGFENFSDSQECKHDINYIDKIIQDEIITYNKSSNEKFDNEEKITLLN